MILVSEVPGCEGLRYCSECSNLVGDSPGCTWLWSLNCLNYLNYRMADPRVTEAEGD